MKKFKFEKEIIVVSEDELKRAILKFLQSPESGKKIELTDFVTVHPHDENTKNVTTYSYYRFTDLIFDSIKKALDMVDVPVDMYFRKNELKAPKAKITKQRKNNAT